MAKDSKIAWTDDTENFWTGCTHAKHLDGTPRPGCLRCYAESWAARTGGKTREPLCKWGDDQPRHRTRDENWAAPYKWDKAAAAAGVRRKVFVNSLADIWDIADPRLQQWRLEAFQIMHDCKNLDWLLLSKRIHLIFHCMAELMHEASQSYLFPQSSRGRRGFPSNIWLGITVENQQAFDEQWPLMRHAAELYNPAKLFFSMEPLKEGVTIYDAVRKQQGRRLDWGIVGGESGNGCDVTTIESLNTALTQLVAHKVPGFMKQLGSKVTLHGEPYPTEHPKGEDPAEWPDYLRIQQFPT